MSTLKKLGLPKSTKTRTPYVLWTHEFKSAEKTPEVCILRVLRREPGVSSKAANVFEVLTSNYCHSEPSRYIPDVGPPVIAIRADDSSFDVIPPKELTTLRRLRTAGYRLSISEGEDGIPVLTKKERR